MPAEPPAPPIATEHSRSTLARFFYKLLAMLSLGLGILGIFLPVLPTTPFILLSAWAATRGSPRLLAWLESHPAFGQMLRDWRRGGVVSRKAKWSATIVMASSALIILVFVRKPFVQVVAIGCMAAVLAWLWCRPESMPVARERIDA
jgi:uncharacterized membrane protein YbaN (DUF454 family)